MENSKNTVQVIGAVLIGVAVGAVVGMLFAPEKGSRTRKRLMRSAEDAAQDLKSSMKEQINSLRHEAHQMERAATAKMEGNSQSAKGVDSIH